jgi:hypothetical protein
LNIIFGIIVNQFAELRDIKANGDKDTLDYCYICQIQSMVFEKFTAVFVPHIEKDHHLWDYIYFIVHLEEKDQSTFNGVESTVHEKYTA